VRVIVRDTKDEAIAGRGSVQIELLDADDKPADGKARVLFSGRLNHHGTTEAQFRFPAGHTNWVFSEESPCVIVVAESR
jgi:hypothetical protein